MLDLLLGGEAPGDIDSLQRVRFSGVVQAGQPLQVNWQARGQDWRFSLSQSGREVCRGNATGNATAAPDAVVPAEDVAATPPFTDAGGCYAMLPHSGNMCLLQGIASDGDLRSWGEAVITADNPLLRGDQLSAWCGLEYAAQLLACHGALQQGGLRKAHIVMLRTLHCHRNALPVGSQLQAKIAIISQQDDALSAGFVVRENAGTALCSGELTAVFA
ncbi:hypothetical protein [Pseudomaricurvus sp. HS19]|uniref:hypothetical protein n=1 Tax=Pseudomaricurvus sp. HS19 TaxID=2692626 RepID=UPI00136CE421|nr:hypothetical protein [Pseudomaricurvus sp. HS19]MYM63959.1 hypothetical protein [Pseudomaricurvus sp. HS19]